MGEQPFKDLALGAHDLDDLRSCGRTTDQYDVAPRHTECLSKSPQDRCRRLAVDGALGDPDNKRVGIAAADLRAPGPRTNPYFDPHRTSVPRIGVNPSMLPSPPSTDQFIRSPAVVCFGLHDL